MVHSHDLSISGLVKSALLKRRLEGKAVGSIPPYGYRHVDGYAVVEPDEMRLVQDIRLYWSQGMAPKQVVEKLGPQVLRGKPLTAALVGRVVRILRPVDMDDDFALDTDAD